MRLIRYFQVYIAITKGFGARMRLGDICDNDRIKDGFSFMLNLYSKKKNPNKYFAWKAAFWSNNEA